MEMDQTNILTTVKSTTTTTNSEEMLQNHCYTNTAFCNSSEHFEVKRQTANSNSSSNSNSNSIPSCSEEEVTHKQQQQRQQQQHLKDLKKHASPLIRKQVLCAILTGMGHTVIGTMLGVPSVILPQLTNATFSDPFLDTSQVALFGSLIYVGAIVGSLMGGVLCHYYGQRVTLLISMPLSLVLWLGSSFSPEVWVLQLTRCLLGIPQGFIGAAAATYQAEVTQPELRGRLMSFQDIGRSTGILVVYVIGSLRLTWREVMVICGCITTIPTFIGLLLLPNSPRWLVTRGREEEAHKALVYFRGPHYDSKLELQSIIDHFHQETSNRKTTMEQMKQMMEPNMLYRLLLMGLVMILLQFSGNIPVVTYGVPILEATNSSMNSYMSAVLIAALRVVGVLVLAVIIRRLGRKVLMVTSSLVCAVSLVLIGVYFLLQNIGEDVSTLDWMPLLSLLVYMPFVAIIEGVNGILRPEIFPNSLRAIAMSIMFSVFFLSMFTVTQMFPIVADSIGEHWLFWIFSISCLLLAVTVGVLLPETRGLTLEEIDNRFRHGNKIQVCKKSCF